MPGMRGNKGNYSCNHLSEEYNKTLYSIDMNQEHSLPDFSLIGSSHQINQDFAFPGGPLVYAEVVEQILQIPVPNTLEFLQERYELEGHQQCGFSQFVYQNGDHIAEIGEEKYGLGNRQFSDAQNQLKTGNRHIWVQFNEAASGINLPHELDLRKERSAHCVDMRYQPLDPQTLDLVNLDTCPDAQAFGVYTMNRGNVEAETRLLLERRIAADQIDMRTAEVMIVVDNLISTTQTVLGIPTENIISVPARIDTDIEK